jgi:hypothetical protein
LRRKVLVREEGQISAWAEALKAGGATTWKPVSHGRRYLMEGGISWWKPVFMIVASFGL